MLQTTYKSVEFKLYLNKGQEGTLNSWLRICCDIYNRALEARIKTYEATKKPLSLYDQQVELTQWRKEERIAGCPSEFERDALRRLDRGMRAFFQRLKLGQKPGFPRFRSWQRYASMECLYARNYLRGSRILVPGIGLVPGRGFHQDASGKQKSIRIIKRASGWYAQILCERTLPVVPITGPAIGIDVGLESFATLSTGEEIENPRFFRKSEKKLKRLQRRLSRKKKGSQNRKKAVKKLARQHEKIKAQRQDFAHQLSRRLINRFGLIAVEDLNIKGLAKTKLAKSILDAAWGQFLFYLTYKAEEAGKRVVKVDPRGTSQTCPSCGEIQKKVLSDRTHRCPCGLVLDRDHAAALVILDRAAGVAAATTPVEGTTSGASQKRRIKSTRRSRQGSTPG
jgi:putative transposase